MKLAGRTAQCLTASVGEVPLGDVQGQSELGATAGPYEEEMEEGRGARHNMAPRSLLQAWDFSLRIMGRYCGV